MTHSQIAHAWANQTKETSNKNSSLYSIGKQIFSYGQHYTIAYHFNSGIVFLNSNGYSNSTAKHTSHVLKAVSHKRVISLPFDGDRCEPNDVNWCIDTANALASKIVKLCEKQTKARSTNYGLMISHDFDNLSDFCGLVGIDIPTLINHETIIDALSIGRNLDNSKDERLALAQAAKAKKELEKLPAWKASQYNGQLYNLPSIEFRLTKYGKLQTTKGAEVDYAKALNLFILFEIGMDIVGQEIGGFTVEAANNEQIVIGCHTLSVDKLKEFFGK